MITSRNWKKAYIFAPVRLRFSNEVYLKWLLNWKFLLAFPELFFLQNELELIMDYKGTSWISIGWRPLLINKSCRLFPDLENIKWKRNVKRSNSKEHPESAETHEASNNSSRMVDPHNLRPVPKPPIPKNNGFRMSCLSTLITGKKSSDEELLVGKGNLKKSNLLTNWEKPSTRTV